MKKKLLKASKGAADVMILSSGRIVLIALFIVLVIFAFLSGIIKTSFGSEKAVYAIDNGFANLVRNAEDLKILPETESRDAAFTIDKGFYLASFNPGEGESGEAEKPTECGGSACFCICTNKDCTEIDAEKNRGRDCRRLEYKAIIAKSGIKGNTGAVQANRGYARIYPDGSEGRYLYVEEEKTIQIRLEKRGNILHLSQQ